MAWKDWSYTKKGLIIGLVFGWFFGVYSNISTCHTGLAGGCFSIRSAIEFFISFPISFPISILLMDTFESLSRSELKFVSGAILLISPIIFFGLLGLLIGWIIGKIKGEKTEVQK